MSSSSGGSIDLDLIKLFEEEIERDVSPIIKIDSLESDKLVLSSQRISSSLERSRFKKITDRPAISTNSLQSTKKKKKKKLLIAPESFDEQETKAGDSQNSEEEKISANQAGNGYDLTFAEA